jgi:NTP pyrophosphatase (non-canonical NTP hydrolase)
MEREEITPYKIEKSVDFVKDRLNKTLEKKGYGTLASTHEILGVLEEEMHELLLAIHGNAVDDEVAEELADIAVGAIFAIACIGSQTIDW